MGPQAGLHWKHFTITNRRNIEKWLKEGMTPCDIARRMHVHRNSIYKEIKRGKCVQLTSEYVFVEVYCADVAERKYRENLSMKGRMEKIGNDKALAEWVGNLLAKGYSPAAVSALMRKPGAPVFSCTLSEKTIYNYIPKGIFWGITQKHLPRRGEQKRKYTSVTVKRPPAGTSIEQRPKKINDRQEPFHWEMDCVLGKKMTKPCLLVLTERVTRYELILRLQAHTAENVVHALDGIEAKIGPERFRCIFQSITMDNGSEFARPDLIERSVAGGKRTTTYYCHPYSSWERGSNENANGLIRRKFPKGSSFEDVTDEQLRAAQDWINTYPREILGWDSAREMMEALLAA